MLKVCHVISGDLWAGAEVMAFHLLKCLSTQTQIRLKVVLLNDGRLAAELLAAGIDTTIIDESEVPFFKIAFKLRSIFRTYRPEIIHSHRYKENILTFLASLHLEKTKLVTTQHGLPENNFASDSFSGKIKSKISFYVLSRYFDKIIVVSENLKSFFINEHKINPIKIKVIHNGIDTNIDYLQKNSNTFNIGSSGRLFPVKGYLLMVEIAKIVSQYDNFSFVLSGDGPLKEQLDETVRKYKISDIFELSGHVDDMGSFYAGLNVYINTSLHEGIPMTILEAMSYGLPIIAPDVGGIPEIIEHGIDGFLVEGRDPQEYAEKLLLLHRDRALWKKMSAAAQDKVCKSFSRESMSKRYIESYQELIG
jgi:glycosyltransferase involved in cell wall biosynthesis